MHEQLRFVITETSQVGYARRYATLLADRLGLGETETGKVALVVTEAATNLVKHATGGQLLIQPLHRDGGRGVEILALDQGPGIANLQECLRDGYSTAGSPGTGFGAITRLAALFDCYTRPGIGTALLAQMWFKQHGRQPGENKQDGGHPSAITWGGVCVPKAGEQVCGDAWVVAHHAGRSLVCVTDGLGHGPGAAEASREAVRVVRARSTLAPAALLADLHAALRGTRGAAAAVAVIDLRRQVVDFAGVGNIAGEVLTAAGSRKMVSHHGILGQTLRKIQEFRYPWSRDALLVLHSDGLASRWSLEAYPGLITRHPGVIAGVLYRDFQRGHDDVTVVVGKEVAA